MLRDKKLCLAEIRETRSPLKLLFLALLATVNLAVPAMGEEGEVAKIRDNLFLLEEAYNQEPGVIQHIQFFKYDWKNKAFDYNFTEEWPVPKETHQLSATVPLAKSGKGIDAGLGDVLVNYRYQAILEGPMAFAPRLSLVLPTGDAGKGTGKEAFGLQCNLPLSYELGNDYVVHANAGFTVVPGAKGAAGDKATTFDINTGLAFVWLMKENFNLLVETGWLSEAAVIPTDKTDRVSSFFVGPGLRGAINAKGGLQIVPGFSLPIERASGTTVTSALFYLSFEHPAF